MKVSVAMATFNGGRYLCEQLDSIGRQSLLPAEIIISDDGSSDDTLEVARRFADEAPCKVVIDDHGQRLGFTRNFVRAIQQCAGEIVALCDQDDVWHDEKLAVAVAPFTDPAVTTVTHRVEVVDEALRPTGLVAPTEALRGQYTVFNIDPWFGPNGMQMLFRREKIAPWLGETPPLSAYGFGNAPFDEWIFYLGTLTGTAVLLRDVLGVWRRHGTALTRDVQSIQVEESAAHHLNLALHSGAEAYAFRAEVTDSRADFAALQIASADGATATAVAGAEAFYRNMSRTFRRRVGLHDPNTTRFRRLLTFGRMVARNDYRRRNRGGLGGKAILKDGFTIFFGPRAILESKQT